MALVHSLASSCGGLMFEDANQPGRFLLTAPGRRHHRPIFARMQFPALPCVCVEKLLELRAARAVPALIALPTPGRWRSKSIDMIFVHEVLRSEKLGREATMPSIWNQCNSATFVCIGWSPCWSKAEERNSRSFDPLTPIARECDRGPRRAGSQDDNSSRMARDSAALGPCFRARTRPSSCFPRSQKRDLGHPWPC